MPVEGTLGAARPKMTGDRRRPLAGLRRARSVPPCATDGLTNAEREKRTSFSRSPPPLGRYHSPPPPTYFGGEGPRYGGRGGPSLRPRVQGGVVRWTFKVPPWTRYLGKVPWQGGTGHFDLAFTIALEIEMQVRIEDCWAGTPTIVL